MNARRWVSLGLTTALLACGVDATSVTAIEGSAGAAGDVGAAGTIAGGRGGTSGLAGSAGSVAKGGGGGATAAGSTGSAGDGAAGDGAAAGGSGGTDGGSGGVGGESGVGGEGGAGADQAGNAGQAGTGEAGQSGAGQGGAGGAGQGGAGQGGAGEGGAGQGGAGEAGAATGGAGQGGTSSGPRCGDGLVNQPDEQCDDGNLTDGDACTSACNVSCPAGGRLVEQTHHCFFLSTAKGDAYDPDGTAPNPCTGPGVHVAMLSHPDDAYQVRQGHAFDNAWLGARTYDADGSDDPARYRWFEGPTMRDDIWAPSEPSDFDSRRCVAFTKDGDDVSYENRTCTESKLTLCVREPVCFVGGRLGIVDGAGHCFVSHPGPVDRAGAAAACSATYGGHLASFVEIEELSFLGGLGFREHWVDAVQAAGAGEPGEGWSWPSDGGAPLASDAVHWAGDRPDDGGDADPAVKENCAILTRGRRLDDRSCSATRAALCEIP